MPGEIGRSEEIAWIESYYFLEFPERLFPFALTPMQGCGEINNVRIVWQSAGRHLDLRDSARGISVFVEPNS